MAIKADILQNILSDAEKAKPIKGMPNTYTPEDYNKIMAKNRAMGLMQDGQSQDGRYHATIPEGAVEFDMNGNLRKIGRTAPKMIDLARYTINRYMVEKVPIPKEGEKSERQPGTYIILVLGEPIVKAITAMNELPKTVKAFRFIRQKDDWKYVGAEFIEDTVAYKMKGVLQPVDALRLMQKVQDFKNHGGDELGDRLDDIK
jgi:hypothetical protein